MVLALAFDVRFPPDAAHLRSHRARQAVRGALYAGLVALALWWAAAGELLNAFDAALWLLCFFAVEGNILRYENAEPTPCGSPEPVAAPPAERAPRGKGGQDAP